MESLKKKSYDTAIVFLVTYPKEMRSASDMITPVCTALLFRIAKVRKQSECLKMDEKIKKL
jgi:hypothetical protein